MPLKRKIYKAQNIASQGRQSNTLSPERPSVQGGPSVALPPKPLLKTERIERQEKPKK